MNPSIYVAFSGSGYLCPVEVGALLGIEAKARRVEALAGTSGGAIVAALYAMHRDASLLAGLVRTLDWVPMMDFRSNPFIVIENGIRISTQEGWCDPKPLHDFLLEQTAYATFADIDMDLKVTATDLQSGTLKMFSRDTTPMVKVADAVRASTSIPFVYPPMQIGGRAYVDGGVMRDIPANLLPNDGTDAICVYLTGHRKPTPYTHKLYQVASLTFNAILESQHVLGIEAAPWVKCVDVNTGTLDALDASMTTAQRDHMIQLGKQSVMAAL